MWDRVLEQLRAIIVADAVLQPIFGDRVRMAGSGAAPNPREAILEYTLIADSERETDAPCVIQFDAWAPRMAITTAAERRLRQLFNQMLPLQLEDVGPCWAQYVDGTMLASPGRDGFSGRGVRFRFTPLREKYVGISPD